MLLRGEDCKRNKGKMINEKVKAFLEACSFGDRLTEHRETIDTVEHAAQQGGCTEPEIAKTLSFRLLFSVTAYVNIESWCRIIFGNSRMIFRVAWAIRCLVQPTYAALR